MTLVRHLAPALVAGLFLAVPLSAQDSTGSIAGKVIDQTTQQPLANVEVAVPGTPLRDLSRNDGTFRIAGVRPGTQRVRATRIGYGSLFQEVTVPAGGAATANLALVPAAAILEPVVVAGDGRVRRPDAAAQPAEPAQPLRHLVDHGAQGCGGDSDLR